MTPSLCRLMIALATCTMPVATNAQSSPFRLGDRVRLTLRDSVSTQIIGSVVAPASGSFDTVTVVLVSGRQFAVPISQVSGVERSTRQRAHPVAGLIIGGLVGAGAGAMMGFMDGDDPSCPPPQQTACDGFLCGPWCSVRRTAEQKASMFAAVAGAVGLAAGTLVGATIRTDHWVATPVLQPMDQSTDVKSLMSGMLAGIRIKL